MASQNAFPKKKDPAPDAQTCAHCLAVLGRAGITVLKCARCGLEVYCSKDCQRAHWKVNHKSFCIAKADRAPPPVEPATAATTKDKVVPLAAEGDECASPRHSSNMEESRAAVPPKKKGADPDTHTCAHCLAVLGKAGVANLKCVRCVRGK